MFKVDCLLDEEFTRNMQLLYQNSDYTTRNVISTLIINYFSQKGFHNSLTTSMLAKLDDNIE